MYRKICTPKQPGHFSFQPIFYFAQPEGSVLPFSDYYDRFRSGNIMTASAKHSAAASADISAYRGFSRDRLPNGAVIAANPSMFNLRDGKMVPEPSAHLVEQVADRLWGAYGSPRFVVIHGMLAFVQ